MLTPLIELLIELTIFVYGLAFVAGIWLVTSSFINLGRLADSQDGEITPAHLITKLVFGVLLATSNAISIATVLSLGATSNDIVDPMQILNYYDSEAVGGSSESLELVVFIKTLSRFMGAIALTSGIKHGANFNHPNETARKSARYRLIWGICSAAVLIFPDFALSTVQGYHSSLKTIADIFKLVP
ncbi:hypothetical protein [Vibrio cholerae]|uniref:hypothetical protein n=1 Tax=Vibrio cholerae TaxID=666 RepID=UPI000E698272|nr:hypothetical protein [Vibrio cholerae]